MRDSFRRLLCARLALLLLTTRQALLSTTPRFSIPKSTKWRVFLSACCSLAYISHDVLQVFDLFTVPSYNGYMAAAYKNYTIDWTPKVKAC